MAGKRTGALIVCAGALANFRVSGTLPPSASCCFGAMSIRCSAPGFSTAGVDFGSARPSSSLRIRITPLREQGLLRISVCDNGLGIEPEQLARLQAGLAAPGDRWEHIGVYNVAARLRLLDKRCRFEVRSHPGRGTAVSLYLPLVELTEEEDLDDDSPVDCG